MYFKFVFVASFIFAATFLMAQEKITEGEMTMEMTSYKFSPEIGADSVFILENIDKMKSELKFKYVFNEEVFSMIQVTEGLIGMDTTLIVNDLVNLQTYLVTSSGYQQDTLIFPNLESPIKVDIVSEKVLEEKLFGLTQKEFTCLNENKDTMKIVITDDVVLPGIAPSSMFNAINDGTLLSIEMNIGGMVMNYEMSSFIPEVVNEKYISTDFSQMQNLTETLKSLVGDESEDEESPAWVEELEKEYGEYKPQGINNDILVKIAEEGYTTMESINYILEEKKDLDIPDLIDVLGPNYDSEKSFFESKNPESIVSDFKRWGIYSPSISTVISDTAYWNSLNVYKKKKCLKFAAMHDMYLTPEARKIIVNNAKSIRFITNADESINEKFINGKMGIDEWYAQFDNLAPLQQGKSKGDEEILSIIQYMFDEAFRDQFIEVDINLIDENIVVESKSSKHVMSIKDFYEIDYESEYNEKEERYEYEKDIVYDYSFYRKVVDKIKQVAADNGLRQGYMVYNTQPLGPLGMDEYAYQELVEQYPTLDHYEEKLYLKRMINKVYDPWARLNMSFPYHPEISIGGAETFGPGHLVDVNFDIQYVTTENKLNFINFMKRNAELYSLDAENIRRDSVEIMNNLMQGSENLINYLGNIKISINKTFPTISKSDYRKQFTEDRNDMSAAYYNIDRILGDDLILSDFRYDENQHKEYFTYEGKEYSIDPGEVNMMKFIGQHISENKSGKKFFRENTFSVTTEVYYYLLPVHAKLLKDMVNLPI